MPSSGARKTLRSVFFSTNYGHADDKDSKVDGHSGKAAIHARTRCVDGTGESQKPFRDGPRGMKVRFCEHEKTSKPPGHPIDTNQSVSARHKI